MSQINELSAAASLGAGDHFLIWSTANGDSRRISAAALLAFIEANHSTIGYVAGRGGTVTQITSRVTGVTNNRITGEIVLVSATVAAHQADEFTLTNNLIAPDDIVMVCVKSGGAVGTRRFYDVRCVNVGSGTAQIAVANTATTASPTESIVLQFVVFKGARA